VSDHSDERTKRRADAPLRSGRWRRPDLLEVDLSTNLRSGVLTQMEEFGWQAWCGTVYGVWELNDEESPIPDDVPGLEEVGFLDEPVDVDEEDYQVRLRLGRVTAHAIRLGEMPRMPGAQHLVEADDLFTAADEISQLLSDIVGPLVGDGLDMFSVEVMAAVGHDAYLDELLVMDETELDHRFRGVGIGAWVDARVIHALAPNETTLVAAKAAPLSRSDFLPRDADPHRDFTPAERAAWRRGQQTLCHYWSRTLGLSRLEGQDGLLVGLGGANEARQATLDRWARE
jgi:hypothetical protein